MQALDDAALKELGRLHTRAGSARRGRGRALDLRALFVRSDLCAAAADARRPGRAELKRAIAEAAEHLSLYQLTIEPDTPFFGAAQGRQARRCRTRISARDLYDLTQEICAGAGLPAYEISNHARPGAECRHNLVYWRGHEYAGIGPGAHGRLNIDGRRYATETEKRPESWLMRVEAHGHGLIVDETLTPGESADEFLLMGLRLAEGIDPQRYHAHRRPRRSIRSAYRSCASEGAVETTADGRLRVTQSGFPVLDAVVADLRSADPGLQVPRARTSAAARGLARPAARSASTRSTASPRSLVPSGRKRNTPSMPAEARRHWSALLREKRCGPCVFTSAATSATAS